MKSLYKSSILLLMILTSFSIYAKPVDVKTYIPEGAYKYGPLLKQKIDENFSEFSFYPYFYGLVEQESCISLTHSKCWNPQARLKTKREEGAGFGQFTRAYNKDGSIRFDTVADMRKRYHKQLGDLRWNNIYHRPDLQLTAMILLSRENYGKLYMIPKEVNKLAMMDAMYNGGSVSKDRKACGLRANCDPNIWFGHVEKTCTKSKKALYGNRSACDINREHVYNVLKVRLTKYYVNRDKLQ